MHLFYCLLIDNIIVYVIYIIYALLVYSIYKKLTTFGKNIKTYENDSFSIKIPKSNILNFQKILLTFYQCYILTMHK